MADFTDFPAFPISAGVGTARLLTASVTVIAAAETACSYTPAIETAAYYRWVGVDTSFSAVRLLAASITIVAVAKAANARFSAALTFAARGSFSIVGRRSNIVIGIEEIQPET